MVCHGDNRRALNFWNGQQQQIPAWFYSISKDCSSDNPIWLSEDVSRYLTQWHRRCCFVLFEQENTDMWWYWIWPVFVKGKNHDENGVTYYHILLTIWCSMNYFPFLSPSVIPLNVLRSQPRENHPPTLALLPQSVARDWHKLLIVLCQQQTERNRCHCSGLSGCWWWATTWSRGSIRLI